MRISGWSSDVCSSDLQAIYSDPDWREGGYLDHDVIPKNGLAVARMAAHITYLSEAALHRKFGRNLQNRERITYGFEADFQVESYQIGRASCRESVCQ